MCVRACMTKIRIILTKVPLDVEFFMRFSEIVPNNMLSLFKATRIMNRQLRISIISAIVRLIIKLQGLCASPIFLYWTIQWTQNTTFRLNSFLRN